MKTCLSIAVLSTGLIGGLAATSSPADAYAGWSCKPGVMKKAYGPASNKLLVLAQARAQWVAYVQEHYGAAYLHPNGVSTSCHDWQYSKPGYYPGHYAYCHYAAQPCNYTPPASETNTKAGSPAAQLPTPLPSPKAPPAPPPPGPLPLTQPVAQGGKVSSGPPGGKVTSRPNRVTGAPVGQGRFPSLRPRALVAVK